MPVQLNGHCATVIYITFVGLRITKQHMLSIVLLAMPALPCAAVHFFRVGDKFASTTCYSWWRNFCLAVISLLQSRPPVDFNANKVLSQDISVTAAANWSQNQANYFRNFVGFAQYFRHEKERKILLLHSLDNARD
jgi:hypothetical protein